MRLLAIFCILALAGCATPEQRAEEIAAYITENYSQACAKLGYQSGTDGHRNCMLSMYNTDQVRMSASWGASWGPSWGRGRR